MKFTFRINDGKTMKYPTGRTGKIEATTDRALAMDRAKMAGANEFLECNSHGHVLDVIPI